MSGIAGIFYRDGRPAERSDVARMVDTIAHRGPDGAGVWVDGAVGLGHRMLHTTPESLHERLPLTSRCGNYTITADARIDNRDELIGLLGMNDRPRELIGDTEIILAAYIEWGERCPERLLGDFAFAIWDGRKRQLFCARDFIGARPFYYYLHKSSFGFASELSPLFTNPVMPHTPNLGMVVEYLLSSVTDKEATLYQNIMRLAPGQALCVRADCVRKIDVPVIEFSAPIRYRTDEVYAEHFQSLLHEAVRCRMRSTTPVGAHLSGGLDSTSVAVTAYELQTNQGDPGGFETYSQVFPGLSCNESNYINQVCQKAGFVSNRVVPEVLGIEYYQEQARRYHDFPDYPNGGYMSMPLNSLARQKGVRVMLTGHGGNQWLEGQFEHLTDLVRHRQVGLLIRQLRGINYLFNRSWQSLMLSYGIKPFIPAWLFQIARSMLGRRDVKPDWIAPELLRQSRLFDRHSEPPVEGSGFASHAQAATYTTATGGWLAHANEMCERIAAQSGIEERHPLHDRRVVQFALNIPSDQIWRGEKVKFVMCQAMRQRLPSHVLERTTQAEFADLFLQTFRAIDIRQLCSNLQIARIGWVDGNKVRAMADESMNPHSTKQQQVAHIWPLCGVFGIELWYRSLTGHQAV